MKVFVIPFAGGSSTSFFQWKTMTSNLQYVFLDPPGKGSRMNEKCADTMEELVIDVKQQIIEYIKNYKVVEYTIFGHSMGGYIAYEIVSQLIDEEVVRPKFVVLSATAVPDELNNRELKNIVIDDKKFEAHIQSFGLVSEQAMSNIFFRKKYLPIIRQDYIILSNYVPANKNKLNINAIIMYGYKDAMRGTSSRLWSNYFVKEPTYLPFNGDHFFIFNDCESINEKLENILINNHC